MLKHSERFTKRAEQAVTEAYQVSAELGHSYVGTEHLLVGLLREGEGLAYRILCRAGLDAPSVTELLVKQAGRGTPGAPAQGLSSKAKKAMELAVAEGSGLGHGFVGTEHILMGILRQPDCAGCRLVEAAGLDANHVYTQVVGVFERPNYGKKAEETPTVRTTGLKRTETKTLDQYSRDLTELAAKGQLDPVVGRQKELERVIQILSRRTKNNPILLGEPGVGKTAVAEALAQRMSQGLVPPGLRGKRLVALDIPSMLAGTKYRGDFEDRVKTVMREVQKAGDVLLFVDEIHTLIGAGAAEGAIDAANILKPALGRGQIQVIGATTLDEYRRHIEKDAALERRFQPVTVAEPTQAQSIAILTGLRDRYEKHHGLIITDEAVTAAVALSARYIHDRFLPDKAIDLMDEAASRVAMEAGAVISPQQAAEQAARQGDFETAAKLRRESALDKPSCRQQVVATDIAWVVSGWTGVPVEALTADESQRLSQLETILHQRVVGQEEAVSAVCRAIRLGRVGLADPKRPVGSFLFLGPTGVGKTELCRALAQAVYGDETAMIRVDMSEYMEKHTVSRLVGAPPGYVGHEEGGYLTDRVRRKPWSVVLFDEIEKAHQDVLNLLLQILEDGVLTDSSSRKTDFRNTLVVMTSNVGAKTITAGGTTIGFSSRQDTQQVRYETMCQQVMAEARTVFRPEFLNRVDDVLVFRPLTEEEISSIAANMVADIGRRLAQKGITLTAEPAAIKKLAQLGFDPVYGARPLRRCLRQRVEDKLAEMLLTGAIQPGDRVTATLREGEVAVEKVDEATVG
jgi:ATP-dependent Clp protease ATP-binding subunit ClpC